MIGKIAVILIIFILAAANSGCIPKSPPEKSQNSLPPKYSQKTEVRQENTFDAGTMDSITAKYGSQQPRLWSENIPEVLTRIKTRNKLVALTFDACGTISGTGYDKKLIEFLIREKIPATLFISARWIDANPGTFMELAANPQFEIENHGYLHKPLSVTGRSVYGIKGTENAGEAAQEILLNQNKIEKLTGRKPLFFRSGTAFYDDVAVKIAYAAGVKPVNYNILGDAGATYSAAHIKHACLSASPGSIIILHMNHPEKSTAQGVMSAVPELRKRGFSFVKLEDYRENLE